MKKIIIVALLVCLVFSINTKIEKCGKNSQNVRCSTQEDPVCAITSNGSTQKKQTFANHCLGCSIGKANFTVGGRCEGYPEKVSFCSPESKEADVCTQNVEPTCGWLDNNLKCFGYRCFVNASNKCEACKVKDVLYTTDGKCKAGPIHP